MNRMFVYLKCRNARISFYDTYSVIHFNCSADLMKEKTVEIEETEVDRKIEEEIETDAKTDTESDTEEDNKESNDNIFIKEDMSTYWENKNKRMLAYIDRMNRLNNKHQGNNAVEEP